MSIILQPKAPIKAIDRYKHFLRISSYFLPAPYTGVEINILDELYYTPDGITTQTRKDIAENLGISSEQLTNYIRALRIKKAIVGNNLNPQLRIEMPENDRFTIEVIMAVIA